MFNLYSHIEALGKVNGYPNIQQLCIAAGVPRSVMTELKKGRTTTLSLKTAQKFADLLNVSVDMIYGREKTGLITDDLLMVGLLDGDTEGFTSEMLEEVKRYAKYVRDKGTL